MSKYLINILVLCILFSCKPMNYKTKTVCRVIKERHMENESTNSRGDFQVVHYFLYEDGELDRVKLKDYLSFNSGDTICKEIKYLTNE